MKKLNLIIVIMLVALLSICLVACGEQGPQGEQGPKGEDGHTPVITIGTNGNWFIDGVDTGVRAQAVDNAGDSLGHDGTIGLIFCPLNKTECAVAGGTASLLEEIVIPSTWNGYKVTTILGVADAIAEYGGFGFCPNLKKLTIPDSVTTIGEGAFYYCENLTSIIISDSVTSIGGWAFSQCPELTIYCELSEKANGWDEEWNPDNIPVYWAGEWGYDEDGNPVPKS